jgi:hypothetical protein
MFNLNIEVSVMMCRLTAGHNIHINELLLCTSCNKCVKTMNLTRVLSYFKVNTIDLHHILLVGSSHSPRWYH